jgi:hypothetical protein
MRESRKCVDAESCFCYKDNVQAIQLTEMEMEMSEDKTCQQWKEHYGLEAIKAPKLPAKKDREACGLESDKDSGNRLFHEFFGSKFLGYPATPAAASVGESLLVDSRQRADTLYYAMLVGGLLNKHKASLRGTIVGNLTKWTRDDPAKYKKESRFQIPQIALDYLLACEERVEAHRASVNEAKLESFRIAREG